MDSHADHEGQKQPSQGEPEKNKGFPTELITEPQEKLGLNKLVSHLLHVEPKDVTLKWVFDHVRNYIISGVVLWAGINAFKIPNKTYIDTFTHSVGGLVLIGTAFVLFALNITHGLAGFSKLRNLNTVGKFSYIACAFLALFAAQILFITAKSS